MHAGQSTGVLGTNDNEAANDSPLPDGSQAENTTDFISSWQVGPASIGALVGSLLVPLQMEMLRWPRWRILLPLCAKVNSECARPTAEMRLGASGALTCQVLFSSDESPLSSCFGVVSINAVRVCLGRGGLLFSQVDP